MPTIIVLDTSLSMARPVPVTDSGEQQYQRRHLAIHGINAFLDYLSLHSRLEFVALSLVSSIFEPVVSFTRDFESIKTHLNKIETYGKTCIEEVFGGVRNLVLDEWGAGIMIQILLVTDGRLGIGTHSLKSYIHSTRHRQDTDASSSTTGLPFPFPSRIHVLCVENPSDPNLETSRLLYERIVELNRGGGGGHVFVPEAPLSLRSTRQMFMKLCETHYVPFHGVLRCGNLVSQVQLSPPPEPYSKSRDFDVVKRTMGSEISICGFVDINDVASPAAHSRHLVLPIATPKNDVHGEPKSGSEADEETTGSNEDGKTPSFCVLLHGSLKVALMVAICHLGEDWYGMLYSWADSKKKSNLMLSVFEPGLESVPWFGKLDMLTLAEPKPVAGSSKKPDDTPHFPVKPTEKKSYAQSSVIWIRQSGLQSDIQKIVRNARKLPEKTQIFYKELNRLKRGALAFGFSDLLDGIASILDRECTLLPGTAHPDAALQLSHAANFLRSPHSRDYNSYVQPLRTKFTSDDLA